MPNIPPSRFELHTCTERFSKSEVTFIRKHFEQLANVMFLADEINPSLLQAEWYSDGGFSKLPKRIAVLPAYTIASANVSEFSESSGERIHQGPDHERILLGYDVYIYPDNPSTLWIAQQLIAHVFQGGAKGRRLDGSNMTHDEAQLWTVNGGLMRKMRCFGSRLQWTYDYNLAASQFNQGRSYLRERVDWLLMLAKSQSIMQTYGVPSHLLNKIRKKGSLR